MGCGEVPSVASKVYMILMIQNILGAIEQEHTVPLIVEVEPLGYFHLLTHWNFQ